MRDRSQQPEQSQPRVLISLQVRSLAISEQLTGVLILVQVLRHAPVGGPANGESGRDGVGLGGGGLGGGVVGDASGRDGAGLEGGGLGGGGDGDGGKDPRNGPMTQVPRAPSRSQVSKVLSL